MASAPRAELLLDADFETMIISHGLFGVRGLAVGNLCLRLLVKIASIFRGCLGTGVLRSAFTTRSVFSWSLFYTQGLSLQNFRRSDCFGFGGPAELPSGDPESGLHLSSTTSAPTEPIIEAPLTALAEGYTPPANTSMALVDPKAWDREMMTLPGQVRTLPCT